MGIDNSCTLFFGYIIELDMLVKYLKASSPDKPENTSNSDSDYDSDDPQDLLDDQYGKFFNLNDTYKFEFISMSPYYDCKWSDNVFAFGIVSSSFDIEDMIALSQYTIYEGYAEIKKILTMLGVQDETPSIIAYPNIF